MLSVSPNSVVRSSLEEMLESLRRRDECETAKDAPPALPARPKAAPRARLPSAKRPLPVSFEVGESKPCQSSVNCSQKEKGQKQRGTSLVAKEVKQLEPCEFEFPHVVVASDGKDGERKSGRSRLRCRDFSLDDVARYFVEKKFHVWCQLHDGLWILGQIKSISGAKASVLLSDGSVVTHSAEEILPANPRILDGVDDLVQLSYINEPSVLHNVQFRYSQDKPYTKAGPVLVAVNPCKDIQLYGNDLVTAYRQKLLDMPHVYAVAEAAFHQMMTDDINQSIIVSGESGAGKTETAKTALQYLTTISGGSDGIESKLLQTGCILEAFGNAKTAKSDNSSRFGKLIEIFFSATGHICGAKLQTLLLEKSRVVQLVKGDRSFHIFYQLCSGAPSNLRGRLRLKRASDYNYLNQSDCLEIHNIDDAKKFHMLVEALNTLTICKEDQEHVFEMLAAILWLGNISFLVTDNQEHIEVVADEALANAACLIGCSEQDLMLVLSTRKVQAGNVKVPKRLTQQQAVGVRDALAKFIYASLFDWLVQKVNSSLAKGRQNTGRSISILDIYGFESFEENSFEQFCINYANERLQQHFNRHLFKLKQEEFELDGVEWTKVDFEDNQDCLNLFEKESGGMISILDEVSTFSEATDLTFATKLKLHINDNSRFRIETGGTFTVCHSAGEVLYDSGKFLEKNRDALPLEIVQLLSSCTGQLPQYFAASLLKQSTGSESTTIGMVACQEQSVATKFKDQLFKLMQHLESTKPHFICCIKPNNKQIPGVFEKDLALEQLQHCGVLEVVSISKFGYPTCMTHEEFTRRYGFLLPGNLVCQDPLSMSVFILQQFDIPAEMYHVGYTKIYLRAGQIGSLEGVRKQVLHGTCETQKLTCGQHICRDIHELNAAIATLQSYVRGEIARKDYRVLLQSKEHVTYDNEQHSAVVQLQSVIRGWLARRHFSNRRYSKLANVCRLNPGGGIPKVKDLPPEILPSVVEALRKEVAMMQVALVQKEKENRDLREQVKQHVARWSEYEIRMKTMEETWQKQMLALQMNLASTKRSLGVDNTTAGQLGRLDGAQSPQFYDSEDMSMGTQTPGGWTPARLFNNGVEDLPPRADTNGGSDPVGSLAREFEQRKQNFDQQAHAIAEVRSGVNPLDELRRLRLRFAAWKKDYKMRLKETRAKVHKLGLAEVEKHRRKWWGKRK